MLPDLGEVGIDEASTSDGSSGQHLLKDFGVRRE